MTPYPRLQRDFPLIGGKLFRFLDSLRSLEMTKKGCLHEVTVVLCSPGMTKRGCSPGMTK